MHLPPEERRAIRRTMLALAWPVVLQSFFRTVQFLVDQFMLGRVGTEAVASMTVIGPIVHTMVAVLSAIGVGTLALVARATGAKDAEKQREGAVTSIALSVAMGVAFLAAGLVVVPWVVRLFEVPGAPAIAENARGYLRLVVLALPFMMLEISGSNILRASGDTRTPMILGLVAILVNVAGNYAFIFGNFGAPRLEVVGAGLATAIAFAVQGLLTLGFLLSRWSPIPLAVRDLGRVRAEPVRKLVRLTVPATIEPVVMQIGFLISIHLLTVLGTMELAAYRAAVTIESLSFMPGFGFSVACSALVGQYLGERRPDKAVAGYGEACRFAVWLMSLLGAVFLVFPHFLIGLFVPGEPVVIATGAMCIAVSAFEQPLMGKAMVLGGALKGAGDTRSPMLIGIFGIWCVRIPLTWLLAIHLRMGVVGAWVTMIADWGLRMVAFYLVYLRGKWKSIAL